MTLRSWVIFVLWFANFCCAYAQADFLPYADRAILQKVDEIEISSGFQGFHRFLTDIDQGQFLDSIEMLNDEERLLQDFIARKKSLSEDNERYLGYNPLFKALYKNKANFYEAYKPNYSLKINPILRIGYSRLRDSGDKQFTFDNLRGIRIEGDIDGKLFYYSDILERQQSFPEYIDQYVNKNKAIPGNGFYKIYNSSISDKINGYDYLNATGWLSYKLSNSVGIALGHGQHFYGDGIRSMIFGDFSSNQFYLKLNAKIGKIRYQSLWTEMVQNSPRQVSGDKGLAKKYMALHTVSIQANRWLELGLCEGVMFAREEGTPFEFQYLNPVILYRFVEHQLDSEDNVIIGMFGKINVANRIQLYSSLTFDEFHLKNMVIERNGWWANKYALQMGVKYPRTLGIDGFFSKWELNVIRPYTFSHRGRDSDWVNGNQPIAHGMGANLVELLGEYRIELHHKWFVEGRIGFNLQGLDVDTLNFGSDPRSFYDTRVANFGNDLLQGDRNRIFWSFIDVNYELMPYTYVTLSSGIRSRKGEEDVDNMMQFGIGLRMNFFEPQKLF